MRHWETFEHTADMGLSARADSLAELFTALGEALAAQICRPETVRPTQTMQVTAQAEDVEALAVEFLSALLRLFQIDKFVFSEIHIDEITETKVRATVSGEQADPARHELGEEIKAVTWHKLRVAQEGQEWVGQVILDL